MINVKMQCLIGDKEALSINRSEKYCQEHYAIYDTLLNVYISNFTYLSWKQFLQLIISITLNLYPYAPELTDANGKPIDDAKKIAETELKIINKFI